MKYLFAAFAALHATNALAHSGHVTQVGGHTHTMAELALMGAAPIVVGLAILALYLFAKRNNG